MRFDDPCFLRLPSLLTSHPRQGCKDSVIPSARKLVLRESPHKPVNQSNPSTPEPSKLAGIELTISHGGYGTMASPAGLKKNAPCTKKNKKKNAYITRLRHRPPHRHFHRNPPSFPKCRHHNQFWNPLSFPKCQQHKTKEQGPTTGLSFHRIKKEDGDI